MAYSQQRETDPLIVYQFGIEVGGTVTGYFQEIGGINSESEVIEFKVSTEGKDFIQKMPGRLKWGDVTSSAASRPTCRSGSGGRWWKRAR